MGRRIIVLKRASFHEALPGSCAETTSVSRHLFIEEYGCPLHQYTMLSSEGSARGGIR